jgi:hypothetical protein
MEDMLIFGAILAPFALYAVAQTRALRRWQGGWRWAAWLPPAGFAFWAVGFALDVGRDPTARNLWPLELMMWVAIALAFLTVMALARWLAGKPAPAA